MFISMMAPRGIVAAAVSAIFALELSELGDPTYAEEASRIVPIVFSVIFGTVTFYGLAAAPVARRLGLATPTPQGVARLARGRLSGCYGRWKLPSDKARAHGGAACRDCEYHFGIRHRGNRPVRHRPLGCGDAE